MNHKLSLLLLLVVSVFSCNKIEYQSESDTYAVQIQEQPFQYSGFTNHYQDHPLELNAERMTIAEALSFIYLVDPKNVEVKDLLLDAKSFSMKLIQKGESENVKPQIIKELEKALAIKIEVEVYHAYDLSVVDTVQFLQHQSQAGGQTYTTSVGADRIQVENATLTELGEVLNQVYQDVVTIKDFPARISFAWKNGSFKETQQILEKELGIAFYNVQSRTKRVTVESIN
ncbi:MAG: hypothetical protein AAF242_06895 [Bacteroidota bacterium]